jgi:hypothetical protein
MTLGDRYSEIDADAFYRAHAAFSPPVCNPDADRRDPSPSERVVVKNRLKPNDVRPRLYRSVHRRFSLKLTRKARLSMADHLVDKTYRKHETITMGWRSRTVIT